MKRLDPILEKVQRLQTDIRQTQEYLEKYATELDKSTKKFEDILDRAEKLPKDADLQLSLSHYRLEIDSLKERINRVDSVINQTPEKVLSISLIKRDVEEVRRSLDERWLILLANFDRLDSFFKWAFGAILFAIILPPIGSALTRKRQDKSEADKNADG